MRTNKYGISPQTRANPRGACKAISPNVFNLAGGGIARAKQGQTHWHVHGQVGKIGGYIELFTGGSLVATHCFDPMKHAGELIDIEIPPVDILTNVAGQLSPEFMLIGERIYG